MNHLEGIHKDYSYWLDAMKFEEEEDFMKYIQRLRAVATQVMITLLLESIYYFNILLIHILEMGCQGTHYSVWHVYFTHSGQKSQKVIHISLELTFQRFEVFLP